MDRALGATGLHIKYLVIAVTVIMLERIMRRNVQLIVERPLKDGKSSN